jgi:hypothetical protein
LEQTVPEVVADGEVEVEGAVVGVDVETRGRCRPTPHAAISAKQLTAAGRRRGINWPPKQAL